MKLKLLALSVLILALGLNTAEAQSRYSTQRQRVKQGIHSGELTRAETRHIGKMQYDNRRDVRSAKRDGVITNRERREIRSDRRHTSRAIYRKKHNNRERF